METPHNDETHRNDDLYNDPEPCIQPKLLQTLTINLIPSNTSHTAVKQPLTYSTWEWSGGNDFAPIDLRASSPPLGSVSSEYRAIDRTIEKFRAFMNFVAKTECKADHKAEREHSARDFRHGLDWREEQLLKAEIRLEVNRPYRFMPPWPLELREQCVKHRALLDRYYRVEGRVGARVKERMEYYKRIEKIKEVNEQMRSEIAMLNEVREAREKDEQEGNDFVVLGIVLDEVEAKLNKNIEQLADGMNMDDGEAQEILTDLPKYISATIFSGDHPELAMRFGHLVQRERDLFPSRFERSTRKKVIRFNVGEEPSFDRKRASPSKQNGSTKKMKGGGSSDRKHANNINNEGSKDNIIR